MRLVLSSLIVIAGLLSSQATAATTPEQTASADIRDSGFVYCVSGQVNTFNPQKASSGLIVDTLAAQLYDRLLDVDPYTYRLVPELAESWEVLDNGATYRFHLRRDVSFQKTAWFTPTRKLNADDVVFTFQRIFDRRHPWHNINGSSFPYFDSLQFADNVKSVRKLDNNTVEFRLTQPDASFLPRASWAYDNDAKITEYNPQKSREQLKALGIENLTLHLWVPTSSQAWNPSPLKTAELIQADMAQVGVKVVIVPVEGRFQEARLMDMNHDLTLSGWATDSNDPDSFFRPLLSCAAINSQTNFAHWCNPEFDSVLRKALSSQQLASRIEAYEEAQNILEKELPILPLASSLRLQAYRYDIKGLVLSPFGNASFAGVSREKHEEVKKP